MNYAAWADRHGREDEMGLRADAWSTRAGCSATAVTCACLLDERRCNAPPEFTKPLMQIYFLEIFVFGKIQISFWFCCRGTPVDLDI